MSKKKTFVTLEQLKEIDKTYPTPYHLYDEKGIRENAKRLKEAFSWNKGYREYFAVKATPNPYILFESSVNSYDSQTYLIAFYSKAMFESSVN